MIFVAVVIPNLALVLEWEADTTRESGIRGNVLRIPGTFASETRIRIIHIIQKYHNETSTTPDLDKHPISHITQK